MLHLAALLFFATVLAGAVAILVDSLRADWQAILVALAPVPGPARDEFRAASSPGPWRLPLAAA